MGREFLIVARMAAAVAAAALGLAAPAQAQGICGLKVYDSNRGTISGDADPSYRESDQFVVCFEVAKDGYVTLWDRMPTTGPVERLVPNANYTGEGREAARVEAGTRRCFGTGEDGYYLQMDPNDGDGLGLMWLVFTETEDTHPTAASFSSADQFAASYRRFGAGVDIATGEGDAEIETSSVGGDCIPKKSLNYPYAVQ